MSKTQLRRSQLLEELVAATEASLRTGGLAALKSRDIARSAGCAVGHIYNVVDSLDELVLRVGSRTLARLGEALREAAGERAGSPADAVAQLVRIAIAYCDFAEANLELWRVLFEHSMPEGAPAPDWVLRDQIQLFEYILEPLRVLLPEATAASLQSLARALFSCVHGMVLLGLEGRAIAVQSENLRGEIGLIVEAVLAGYPRVLAERG